MAPRLVLAAGTLLALGRIAAAQTTTAGDIAGVVRDPAGFPVAGATVKATGPQGVRATFTDATGSYLLEFLAPGRYAVTAFTEGLLPVTQPAVDVHLGGRATVNLSLAPFADASETITITTPAPTVDVETTSTTTNISSELIGNVPTGRSFAGLVALAPGVVAGGIDEANPSISGASALENSYVVDGVNVTNPGYGAAGSYSIIYGSFGSGLNLDFLDSVLVKTAGFEAEYGEALGGVINVTTRRGSNEFHGSLFANSSPDFLQSERRQVYLVNGFPVLGKDAAADVGVTVGGPISKDRLFFFAAVNPQANTLTGRAPAGFPLATLGNQVRRRERTAYAGTLTWNMAANHALELSLFGDPGTSQQGWQSLADLLSTSTARYSEFSFGGDNEILRYTGVFGAFMSVEASASRAINNFAQQFPPASDSPAGFDLRNPNAVRQLGGIGFYEKSQTGDNTQYNVKATNYFDAGGRHELKYGGGFQQVKWNADIRWSGPAGGTFTDASGTLHSFTTGVVYLVLNADDGVTPVYRVVRGEFSNPVRETRTDYASLFLQDKYAPIPTISIDLGLRAEQQRIAGSGPGSLGYTFKFADNLQPRLGASWDFTGKGRGKLFAHYGTYVEKASNDLAVRELSTDLSVARADYFSDDFVAANQIPEGTTPVQGDTSHVRTLGSVPNSVEPGTKSGTESEITAGAEYEVFETVNAGVRYIHRSVGRVLEDFLCSSAETPCTETATYEDYLAASPSPLNPVFVIGNPGSWMNRLCPPGEPGCWTSPRRDYDALELTVHRRLATNWQVLASWRISRLVGNWEGLYRNDNGQSDPNISSNLDFPNNSPLMRHLGQSGALNTDRTHVIKVAGSYLTRSGVNVGTFVTWETGTPKDRLDANLVYGTSGEIPDGRRGSFGREPDVFTVDMHVDYRFSIRKGTDLTMLADVFNVLDDQRPIAHYGFAQFPDASNDPDYGRIIAYQQPRTMRLGVRLTF